MSARAALLLVVVVCLGLARGASATGTGAAMGGGDWSSRSAAATSASGDAHHTTGWDLVHSDHRSVWDRPTPPPHPDDDDDGSTWIWVAGVFGVPLLVAVIWGAIYHHMESSDSGGGQSEPPSAFVGAPRRSTASYADVTVLRVAIDGRSRAFVRSELARITAHADVATPAGRATQLREVALLLRRLKDAWVQGGAVNEDMRAEAEQRAAFDRYVADARRQAHAAASAAPSGDDPGLVLVTLVIAAHAELFTVTRIGDGAELRQALEAASHRTAEDLIAIAVIVAPDGDGAAVSASALAAAYPRPALIPIQGSLDGKVVCAACGGPFLAELLTCPHCGAPATGARLAV